VGLAKKAGVLKESWGLNDPEYILAHEIAGHAEPRLNDKGDGKTVSAVEVENIIRKETNAKERREEPNHVQ
jgi:hypothetical protein